VGIRISYLKVKEVLGMLGSRVWWWLLHGFSIQFMWFIDRCWLKWVPYMALSRRLQ